MGATTRRSAGDEWQLEDKMEWANLKERLPIQKTNICFEKDATIGLDIDIIPLSPFIPHRAPPLPLVVHRADFSTFLLFEDTFQRGALELTIIGERELQLLTISLLHSLKSFSLANLFEASAIMPKRAADDGEDAGVPLKQGERPPTTHELDEANDFGSDSDDEFESEEEIFEAGADGQPDGDPEEERKGTWTAPVPCTIYNLNGVKLTTGGRCHGPRSPDIHSEPNEVASW